MTVKIIPNEKSNPPGKLADAELHFTDGPLDGLKLIGFSIWERRGPQRGYEASLTRGEGSRYVTAPRNVTFPARAVSVNGKRWSFALLRPISDVSQQDRIRELILQAYAEHEEYAYDDGRIL